MEKFVESLFGIKIFASPFLVGIVLGLICKVAIGGQTGNILLVVMTAAGALADARASELGQRFLTPLATIFTKHPGPRPLSPTGSFLAIDNPAIRLVALKRAEAGDGLIVRLWKDDDNSYHLKGMWVDYEWMLLTGNNLNPRAWRLDLENAILTKARQLNLAHAN